MNAVDRRWKSDTPHYPEAVRLVKLVDNLDTPGHLDLKMGGDGDMGETLAYYLDELIDLGMIAIRIL